VNWRVVELWTVPAEELLQTGDIGLVPWIPLTDFADPPEKMTERCRNLIDEGAPPGEKANLLAVTQVLAFLRYNSLELLTILGGKQVMLEVPYLDEIVLERYENLLAEKTREAARENAHENIAAFLEARFGDVPRDLVEAIESVVDEKQLEGLVRSAGTCRDLAEFRRAMTRG
jgi:hypothetical protein